MCAHKIPDQRAAGAAPLLSWLPGGPRPQRSAQPAAGVLVALDALLAGLTAGLAISESARWPTLAVLGCAAVVGLLVGAAIRATAGGPAARRAGVLARGAVALAVGAVVGELAALVLFCGPIDRRLDEQAARRADAAPAVVQASAVLGQARATRAALDNAVDQARRHRDDALVVARCEYHPSPACPQTRITGVPGTGPETQTADQSLAESQRELDTAVAARDRQAPALDSRIVEGQQTLARARRDASTDPDRGLGARWVALQELTLANPGALLLRALTAALCMLLNLLPLLLRLWRGETSHDRHAAARAERERAEIEADTRIAVKRAEVRAAAETLWAEHQLTAARLAAEAQTEIERVAHQRRVTEALECAIPIPSKRAYEPVDDDIYLPIAAEAEAASRAAVSLPAGDPHPVEEPDNLPATVEPEAAAGPSLAATGAGSTLPDVTRAAARWIRPLVPTFVARAIDTTTQPLRAARQVFEEVEEITLTLKRTRKVTMDAEETLRPPRPPAAAHRERDSSRFGSGQPDRPAHPPIGPGPLRPSAGELPGREPATALGAPGRPGELEAADGPPQLPPGK